MIQDLQHKIDMKTKPLGSLGILENVALQIGLVQQSLTPILNKPTVVIFAGDHGIAEEGVSAYPQEVTYQMVLNFLSKGAAINVFGRQNDIDIKIVDAGVKFDFEPHPDLITAKVGMGTGNFLIEKAMTAEQLDLCFNKADQIVTKIFDTGCNIIGFGEMGIGNTSSAAMIMSSICNLPLEVCTGKGTASNNDQLANKVRILKDCQNFHGVINDPMEVLQTYGGFEVAQICGAMLSAYKKNMLIMVDGFITTAAYLIAVHLIPEIKNNAIFCHLSDESGHQHVLEFLKADPLVNLRMRLGEGTGCAVAYPLIKSAVHFLNEMASFDSAGVSTKND
ncbi:nicotinate-nucleotide--dimethylbenzimidazole phosphoribosyltransferase [Flavobacterium sp. HSC-61S13]|uniref:nicotinate-nucleotide--dimethylbenzimidazole phosphoribosyltransferase n=1 Tax=Flavobacterium sp. HSC-61S13 TaxID=2910963 RepID=UPI00209E54B0|nr:nicotinate-nucleotide--dimethylbenzimidazole phosphoribosyltransferase [Flavobacterium sp. HSC-61S13]MCP1997360.1 nicotinate-nucleotide--dimethylbenzimidazole phosphoribosyltransferase [Flavobacterium sp. HSC-61S13]